MNKIILIILLFISNVAIGQNRPFQVEPERPLIGEEVRIIYNPNLTSLSDHNLITGVIYLCHGDYWTVNDLNLIQEDSQWIANYKLPETCVLFACKFYGENEEWDSGVLMGQYGVFTNQKINDEYKSLPGAYVNWGFLRNATLDKYAIPGFSKPQDQISDTVMQMWIGNEYRYNPESRETLSYFAAIILDKIDPGKANHLFVEDLDFIQSLEYPKEMSLIRSMEIYKNILKDEEKANQLEQRILNQFPKGILARDKDILRIYSIADAKEKQIAFDKFMEEYPKDKFENIYTDLYKTFYPRIMWSIVQNEIFNDNKYDSFYKYYKEAPYGFLSEAYYRGVQLSIKHGLKTHEELLQFSTDLYDELIKRVAEGEDPIYVANSRSRYSPKQWQKEMFDRNAAFYFTHADVLYHTGKSSEALEIMDQLKEKYQNRSSEVNELYTKLLIANKYNQLVIPFIQETLQHDAATPYMIEVLKKDYAQQNHKGNFEDYINTFRSQDYVRRMQEELKNSLIKKEMIPFQLENMLGQKIDMSKLKGNIIVLDFWATWCSPCKAALPGMQMAVDKFENDENVNFFFISTLESNPNFKQQIKQLIEEKNYRMEILYDNTSETGKMDEYYNICAKNYGVNGIPHKMIIDKDGYLRWSSSGYYGNPQELANEITYLINYLKQENN